MLLEECPDLPGPYPTMSSRIGTSTLRASSLTMVRRAIWAMSLASDAAMVNPSRWFTWSMT